MALQTRLDPMNASPHHPKVRVSLKLADTLFVAGGTVAGKMEVECKADKGLGIGVIMVELFAIEELTSRDHSATSPFLHCRRLFQGPGLPPSNAVHPYINPGDPPLPSHHYPARRGVTTFFFQFPLPGSSPSAINFGSGLANVRYELRASVAAAWKGQNRFVMDKKPIDVVECYEMDYANAIPPEAVTVGENGKIWAQARVVNGFIVAGQPTCIELQVKNHSAKKNSGLSVSLTRQLYLPNLPSSQNQPLQIYDTLTSVTFRGAEYIIQPGAEGVANLVVDVPKTARGVKGGTRTGDEEDNPSEPLFEVRCMANVKLSMGIGSKDIHVDLPVMILHPLALPTVPLPDTYDVSPQPYNGVMYDQYHPVMYQSPASPAPYTPHPLSSSPPLVPYHDQGQVWLPPPSTIPYHLLSPPPVANQYHNPELVRPLVSYAAPPRASSVEPALSHPVYGLPASHVQQPLPYLAPNQPVAQREEGKGERASRIAFHLRMSSRHRSASPPAHRYPIPVSGDLHIPAVAPSLPFAVENDAHSSHSVSSSTQIRSRLQPPPLDIPSPARSQSSVVSPRPMLSPKHSFSVDPFTHVTHVENLERIAAHADSKNANMSVSGAELDLEPADHAQTSDRDKTLPNPPVPTGKDVISQVRTQVHGLFPEETPPTPTLAAVTSLKVPRTSGARSESLDPNMGVSGLDALEAKLLAEVGTRKIEKMAQHADVRTVMPIAIPRPTDVTDPAVDSAISSLTLPALGSEPRTLTREEPICQREDEEDIKSVKKETEFADNKKGNGGKKHGGKRSGERADGRDDEFHRLRRAAQGRVAAWLGSIEPDVPPQPVSPPARPDPVQLSQSAERLEPVAIRDAVALQAEKTPHGDDSPGVSAVPNPRSSGFVPIGTLRASFQRPIPTGNTEARTPGMSTPSSKTPTAARTPVMSPRLALYPPQPLGPEVRYDIRSARGGRGGRVTTVAAIWASAMQQKNADLKPPAKHPGARAKIVDPGRTSLAKPVPGKILPSTESSDSPSNGKHSHPPAAPREAKPRSVADVPARRARMAKASTSPAVVSSSLAIPMISSTASLARSSPPLGDRDKFRPPTISETVPLRSAPSEAKVSAAKGELAFGQARLRELIKRYQGQANA